MPQYFNGHDAAPVEGRVGIVVSRYNDTITKRLLQGALETLTAAGVGDEAIDVCWVPGAWELPLVAQELARDGHYAAVICLGAVIRGETTHDQQINRQVSLALGQIALETGLPVAFGVLTCNTLEQALQRAGGSVGNKGQEAAEAAVEMIRLLARLRQPRGQMREEPPVVGRPLLPLDEAPPTRGVLAEPPELAAVGLSGSEAVEPAPVSAGGRTGPASSGAGRRGPRMRRRRGREVVLQMLYADDVHPQRNLADADEFLRRRLNFDPALTEFAAGLLAGVRKHRAEIDATLARHATNWSLPRMAVTDRNVLRLGAYEIFYTDTPRVVVINEAVDLARRYGSQQSAPFVNGILDRLKVERRSAPTE